MVTDKDKESRRQMLVSLDIDAKFDTPSQIEITALLINYWPGQSSFPELVRPAPNGTCGGDDV